MQAPSLQRPCDLCPVSCCAQRSIMALLTRPRPGCPMGCFLPGAKHHGASSLPQTLSPGASEGCGDGRGSSRGPEAIWGIHCHFHHMARSLLSVLPMSPRPATLMAWTSQAFCFMSPGLNRKPRLQTDKLRPTAVFFAPSLSREGVRGGYILPRLQPPPAGAPSFLLPGPLATAAPFSTS